MTFSSPSALVKLLSYLVVELRDTDSPLAHLTRTLAIHSK